MTHTYTFRCIPLEQEAGYIISTKEMIDHNRQVNDVGTVSAMPAKPWSLVKRSDNYDPAVYRVANERQAQTSRIPDRE